MCDKSLKRCKCLLQTICLENIDSVYVPYTNTEMYWHSACVHRCARTITFGLARLMITAQDNMFRAIEMLLRSLSPNHRSYFSQIREKKM